MSYTIACDFGTFTSRCGCVGDDSPSTFPTVVANLPNLREKHAPVEVMKVRTRDFVGQEPWALHSVSNTKFILKDGMVEDWEGYIALLYHALDSEMQVDPSECYLLLSEHIHTPRRQREGMTEISFELFQNFGFQMANSELLSLYSAGRTTGSLLCCGHGVTSTASFWESELVPASTMRSHHSGDDVMQEFKSRLSGNCPDIIPLPQYFDMLNKHGKVCSKSIKSSDQSDLHVDYKLPDGNIIKLGSELYEAPEILFRPSQYGYDDINSMQNILFEGMRDHSPEITMDLCQNIVLEGGISLLPGFSSRLEREIALKFNWEEKIKVVAPNERVCSNWLGMSILGSLSSFEVLWISKGMYSEFGPQNLPYHVATR
jgi:actin